MLKMPSRTIRKNLNPAIGVSLVLIAFVFLSGFILSSSYSSADVVDDVVVTVPISCNIASELDEAHTATINPGQYQSDIGTTNFTVFCNDNSGYAIYAIGYSNEEYGNTKMLATINNELSPTNDINTGTNTSGANSSWAMKLVPVTTASSGTEQPYTPTIESDTNGSFANYHVIPEEYTKVATLTSNTDFTIGSSLQSTYQVYIDGTKPAGTYAGKVKYTLVHPSDAVAGKLNVIYDGNGLTFPNGKATNLVAYEATETETTSTVTKKSYANAYNEEGGYSTSTIGAPVGNRVVTIDGAESIHIAVTYGVPQNNGGPQSDLYIFSGNHPEYTNADSSSAIQTCGTANATNGAYSTTGSGGTQVTMECDIASDSVTFYDYSSGTSNQYSVGYYAVITGQGTVTSYEKTAASGTYQTPTTRTNQDVFLGWSTNPNANADAEEPLYTNEADFIANAPYLNIDGTVTMYAVWGKTFNAAYNDAGKSQLSGHYKMQDGTEELCKEIYVGATETLIDTRDNTTYMAGRLKDGKCWMLDNLALDPTDSTTAANMNTSNTNATQEAINNLLDGGSSTTGWSNIAVANVVTTNFSNDDSYIQPRINNVSKDTLVTSYGPASTNGQAKVGIYYNFCAASASTYCYTSNSGVDMPDTIIDAPQDICPANWRMPTSGNTGEYHRLAQKYGSDAANSNSLQYNLSTPLSGYYYGNAASNQGSYGDWWSSTYYVGILGRMYYLNVYPYPNNVYPSSNGSRSVGRSMRCLMAD